MGLPGYYITSYASVVTLPVAPRYGSPIGVEENDIELTTERGGTYVYEQYEKQVLSLKFRLTASELVDFETMRTNVGRQPFYWLPDVNNPSDVYYVRRSRNFMPKELEEPAWKDGVETALYDLDIELKTEVSSIEIEL